MSYIFQSTSFSTRAQRNAALAQNFFYAGGLNSDEQVAEFLAVNDDATHYADEAISEWDLLAPTVVLNADGDEVDGEPDFTREEIVEAFADFIRDFVSRERPADAA